MKNFKDISENSVGLKDSKLRIIELLEMIILVCVIAFSIKFFIYSTYKVETNEMNSTLIEGDYILVNKFIYGIKIPFTNKTLINFANPKQSEIIIFKNKIGLTDIKRCVAVSGDSIYISAKKIFVNKTEFRFPQTSLAITDVILDSNFSNRDYLKPLRIPQKKDKISMDSLTQYEFDFYSNLIRKENINTLFSETKDIYKNGTIIENIFSPKYQTNKRKIDSSINLEEMTWAELRSLKKYLSFKDTNSTYTNKQTLYKNSKPIKTYTIKGSYIFVIGDNQDNSRDSRSYGFINKKEIIGRASMIYFSKLDTIWNTKRILNIL